MREGMDIDSSEFLERSLDKFAAIRFNGDLPLHNSSESSDVQMLLQIIGERIDCRNVKYCLGL